MPAYIGCIPPLHRRHKGATSAHPSSISAPCRPHFRRVMALHIHRPGARVPAAAERCRPRAGQAEHGVGRGPGHQSSGVRQCRRSVCGVSSQCFWCRQRADNSWPCRLGSQCRTCRAHSQTPQVEGAQRKKAPAFLELNVPPPRLTDIVRSMMHSVYSIALSSVTRSVLCL